LKESFQVLIVNGNPKLTRCFPTLTKTELIDWSHYNSVVYVLVHRFFADGGYYYSFEA
jgi:hypothetical protein